MSIKNKILIFITFILVLFSVAILAVIKMQQDEEMKIFQNKHFENTKILYENINKKYESYYTDIIPHNFSDFDLKEAIKNGDKELLYKLSANKYRILQKQNSDLVMMNFYLPDNTLLLNMNKPKDTYKQKDGVLVQKVHKNKKTLFGYEQSKDYILYKNIHPIFYGKEYIGALELGINIEYILKDMKRDANIDGAMFVMYYNNSSFKLSYKTIKDMEIVDKLTKTTINKAHESIQTRRGVTYSLYSFNIKNNKNTTIAKLHFFNNRTKEVDKFAKDLQNISIFLIVMIFITLIVMNFGVSKLVKDLQSSYDDLYEYTDMIDNNIMIVDTTPQGIITGASQRFCEISGYKQNDLIGKSFKDLKDSEIPEKTYDEIDEILQKDGSWHGDIKNQTKDKKTYWLSVSIEAKLRDKKLICYNYIMHNITARKMNEELVFIDELTKTYNRKYFNDIFPRMVNTIKRNGGCINFVVLDVDDFKKYNELYGHAKGDEALVAISEVLSNSLRRPDDYCFRLGGGEFGILYRSASEEEGYLYTQVLKKNIEMIGIKHEANPIYKVLTASLGLVSLMSDKIVNEKDIYKTAYEHLLRAKEDGRNKIVRKLM